MTSTIMLAGVTGVADFQTYLERLLRFDKAAAVRVVADDDVVGIYGRPPFEVLTLRTIALDEPATMDVTVSAGQLLDGVGPGGAVTVPAALNGATTWAGFLPPRTGWTSVGVLPAAEVETAALAGIAEFKERAETIPDAQRTRAAVDTLAAEIWDRQVSFGVPVRAAHAARAMAFLGQDQSADVVVRVSGRWLLLDAAYGSVIVRTGGLLGQAR